ncbi:hypothetical protein C2E23DRAFT_625992 [Lenzites betulinus]|nr:hypothetical protein C2E23DRAFT_625992 [Lenzites betulinus]
MTVACRLPEVKSVVVPSIVEYLASQDDPWSLDTADFTFQELVQELVNQVFPEQHYRVEKRDNIYKWCQQQVYEWHRTFQKFAFAAVRDEKATRQANTKLSPYDRSDQGILSWLDHALQKGGAAMWGQPNTIKPNDAREQLQSKYVICVMAAHLGRTVGSVLEPPEDAYPVGALSLAAAAVQRAFEWYLNDQPRGIPQSTFSLKSAGELTGIWHDTAVTDLVNKPHRLARLLKQASRSVASPVANTKPSRSKVKAISMYIRERSSSPPQEPFVDFD